MPNVYLTGMMGSGKSVTGASLARILNWEFVDLDKRIERAKGSTIAEIFTREGEAAFRDIEEQALAAVSREHNHVVATGGGVVTRTKNLHVMQHRGRIVYLQATLETLWSRVKDQKERPLLNHANPKEALQHIYLTRKPLYEESCDFIVQTDGKTAEATAREIAVLLEMQV
jgi:shikimate kinase